MRLAKGVDVRVSGPLDISIPVGEVYCRTSFVLLKPKAQGKAILVTALQRSFCGVPSKDLSPPENFEFMVFSMCFPKSGGNSLARSSSEERKKNLEIEKMIRKDKKAQAKQVKILLLGAGESGKSTILKQMRIIYSEGFRLDERKEVRQVIFSNMIVAFKIIAEEMRELGLDYGNEKSQVRVAPSYFVSLISDHPSGVRTHYSVCSRYWP